MKGLFDTLTNDVPIGIFYSGVDGVALYVNKALEKATGYSSEELVGEYWYSKIHPEDRDTATEKWSVSTSSGKPWCFEFRFLLPDGTVTWVIAHINPRLDANSIVVGYIGTIMDITDRKRIEEDLRNAHDLLENRLEERTRELGEAKRKRREMIDNATIGIAETTLDGKFISLNLVLAKMLGYGSQQEAFESITDIGKQIYVEPTSRDIVIGKLERESRTEIFPTEIYLKDGSTIWVTESVSAISDESGKIDHYVTFVTVVTKHVQTEQALLESENRFRDFSEIGNDWFWEIDKDLRYSTLISATGQDLYSISDYLGRSLSEVRPTGIDDESWQAHMNDLEAHRPFRDFIQPRPLKDGSVLWLSVSGKPLFDEDGIFMGYRGTGTDITQRKEIEDALKNAERIAGLGNWQWSVEQNKVIAHSEGYAQVLGLSMEAMSEYQAHRGFRMAQPEDRERLYLEFDSAMKGGRDFQVEYRIVRPDGQIRDIQEIGVAIRDTDGRYKEMKGTIQDITEIKEATLEAERANKAKSEFLSSMSHELRTPMNAVLGFAQMLKIDSRDPLSENQISFVDHILKSGQHLMELIDDVLELSQIEAGKLSIHFDQIATHKIIDESLELIQALAQQGDIEILDQIDRDALPVLWTDRTRLTQVLLNMLSNAVKYNRKGGTVTLSCGETPGQMLRISVADTGMGISEKNQQDLFKSFERLGRETGEIEGTGIGLVVTKRLIELLGGAIGYQSEEGKGSTFWIDVPLSREQAPAIKKPGVSKDSNWELEPEGKLDTARTILYIEDSPANMQLMKSIIGQLNNTRLLTAHNAELGLDLATRKIPDLILMDLNLPGMNGFEALKRLRDTTQTKDIPVIAITASAGPQDIEKGSKAGFKEYIIKPFNVGTCIRIIEETLDSIEILD